MNEYEVVDMLYQDYKNHAGTHKKNRIRKDNDANRFDIKGIYQSIYEYIYGY